jgi:hypothetical protein
MNEQIITSWIVSHLAQIGVCWLAIQKFLTSIQDAIDAQPKDLKPPLGKLIYYMQAIGGYLFLGNRAKAIQQ